MCEITSCLTTLLNCEKQEDIHRSLAPRYPKLRALLSYCDLKSPCRDMINLRFPGDAEGWKTARDMMENFRKSNSARFQARSHPQKIEMNSVDDSRDLSADGYTSVADAELSIMIRNSSLTLFSSLNRHFEKSKCGINHTAKFQIRGNPNREGPTDAIQHKMFVSSCLFRPQWQEVFCSVADAK